MSRSLPEDPVLPDPFGRKNTVTGYAKTHTPILKRRSCLCFCTTLPGRCAARGQAPNTPICQKNTFCQVGRKSNLRPQEKTFCQLGRRSKIKKSLRSMHNTSVCRLQFNIILVFNKAEIFHKDII